PIVIHSFSSWSGIATLTKPSAIAENHTMTLRRSGSASENRCLASDNAAREIAASESGRAQMNESPKPRTNSRWSDRNQAGAARADAYQAKRSLRRPGPAQI